VLTRTRRFGASLALVITSCLGVIAVDAPSASAASGGNHDLWLATAASQSTTCIIEARITPHYSGWYHIHFWKTGHEVQDWNTPEVNLNPVGTYRTYYDLSSTDVGCIHRGQTICGELWLWNQGRWVSRGLPCITH